MGMDLMDLTIRLEREFDTTLTIDDWHELYSEHGDCTVGQIYELLLRRRVQTDAYRTSVSLNEEFWLGFRESIAKVGSIDIDKLQLQTPLDEVFPKSTRAANWLQLEKTTGYRFPPLCFPYWVFGVIALASIALAWVAINTLPMNLILISCLLVLYVA